MWQRKQAGGKRKAGFAFAALTVFLAMAPAKAEEPELRIYNWADYIGNDAIAGFEKETGIKVTLDLQEFIGFQQSVGVVGAVTRLGGHNVVALEQIEPIIGGHCPLPVIRLPEGELQECSLAEVKQAIG